jgi:hypothetical protein
MNLNQSTLLQPDEAPLSTSLLNQYKIISSGIPRVDALLNGGLKAGTITGSSGYSLIPRVLWTSFLIQDSIITVNSRQRNFKL